MTEERKQELTEKFYEFHGFNELNGIELVDVDDGYAVVRVKLTQQGMNPYQIAHGGLTFSLCDVACGVAARTCGRSTVSQDASIYFLKPGRDTEYLTATGRVIKPGRKTAVCECEVRADDGTLIAKSTVSSFYLE